MRPKANRLPAVDPSDTREFFLSHRALGACIIDVLIAWKVNWKIYIFRCAHAQV
jgi:hypothetical protein